jgi:hypothetical protein
MEGGPKSRRPSENEAGRLGRWLVSVILSEAQRYRMVP